MHAENKTFCKENGLSWAGLAVSSHYPTQDISPYPGGWE